MSLIATSVAFAVVGAVTLALQREFVLTNAEVGWVIGAGLWGFAITQAIFAPLCDSLGFRFLLRVAFGAHLAGAAFMIFAGGFWALFFGALVIAMANGLVEAACNPLVATLYPNNKTVKLNQFHVWFPGGIVIGGVAAFLLDQMGIGFWQLKLALIAVPTLVYGAMLLFERFPATENVQAGVSIGEMFKATFTTPLMWVMLFGMAITASTELGPNRWVPAVLEAGLADVGFVGVGILVLAYINGIMALLRYNSEATVARLSPTLILLLSAVVSAVGLFWLSYAETPLMAFLSATVFAVGVAYFWPTMLGFVAERIPRSGSLGLGLMGGTGMVVVGLIATPMMGQVADEYANQRIPAGPTTEVLEEVTAQYPALVSEAEGETGQGIEQAVRTSQEALSGYEESGELPEGVTANALRAITSSRVAVATTGDAEALALVDRAGAILGPANNYGGRIAFRYVVPFTCLLIVLFGVLYWRDRQAGGYRAEGTGAPAAQTREQEAAQAKARASAE